MSADHANRDLRDESIGELFHRLSEDTSTLIRQELELARAELREKAQEAGKGAGLFGAAGVTGLLAAGTLTAFLVLVLDTAMDSWLAALIVALVLGAVAGALALTGKDRLSRAQPPVPEQTIDTVKEDVAWVKTRARSATR